MSGQADGVPRRNPVYTMELLLDEQKCTVAAWDLPIRVGRREDAHLRMVDQGVSKYQVSFLVRGRAWVMSNQSQFGTRLNGRDCMDGRFHEIREGDWLGFGEHRLQILTLPPPKIVGTGFDTRPPMDPERLVDLTLRFREDERPLATVESPRGACQAPIPQRLARLLALLLDAGREHEAWALVPLDQELKVAPTTNSMHRARTDLQTWWAQFRESLLQKGVFSPDQVPGQLFQAEHGKGSRLVLPMGWQVCVVGDPDQA